MNTKVSLGQRRSKHAWESVEALKKLRNKEAEDYARNAKKLPMRIRTAGLGQALAFLLAKSSDKKKDLLHQHLSDWVLQQHGGIQGQVKDSLLESIVQGDSLFLRRCTAEAMAWLEWYNRFAEASEIKQGVE